MAIRVYAFAKNVDIDSKIVVDLTKICGIENKGSALASLEDDEVVKLTDFIKTNPVQIQKMQAELKEDQRIRKERELREAQLARPPQTVSNSQSMQVANVEVELRNLERAGQLRNLVNAISVDMMRGFNHFAVIELGAVFEMMLKIIDPAVPGGLRKSVEHAHFKGILPTTLMSELLVANSFRNEIVHRLAGRFPDEAELQGAMRAFARGVVFLYRSAKNGKVLLEPLANSNPEVLNMLDSTFGLDDKK